MDAARHKQQKRKILLGIFRINKAKNAKGQVRACTPCGTIEFGAGLFYGGKVPSRVGREKPGPGGQQGRKDGSWKFKEEPFRC